MPGCTAPGQSSSETKRGPNLSVDNGLFSSLRRHGAACFLRSRRAGSDVWGKSSSAAVMEIQSIKSGFGNGISTCKSR